MDPATNNFVAKKIGSSNGEFALISKYIPKLEELGIHSVNLSLDTLKKDRFKEITRRDLFDQTMETFYQLVNSSIKLKLNVVVQSGVNTDEIIDFVRLSKEHPIAVRFIEEMPFNGRGQRAMQETWDYTRIFNEIKNIKFIKMIKMLLKLADMLMPVSLIHRVKRKL